MAVETSDDLAIFFNTDDFGTAVTLPDSSIITGIFDNAYYQESFGEVSYSHKTAVLLVKDADAANINIGHTLILNAISYKVINKKPEGQGLSEIVMQLI
jgi:hypothetical protein